MDDEFIIYNKKKGKERSISQNKFYWGVVLEYVYKETGMTPLALHFVFKEAFIPWVTFDDDFTLSTKDLTVEQMWDYILLIRDFAGQFLACDIPDPCSVIRA